jgi:hypothetical protein
MTALPVYSTGTVSVAAGGTVVTGVGVLWSDVNAKEGDFIQIGTSTAVLVTGVTDATHLTIAPWAGAAQSGVSYKIYQNYVGRVVGVAAAEDVGVMLEKLHTDGLPFIVGTDETAPDPSYGDEGQMAFKPDSGEWWTKAGGAWVPSAGLSADNTKVAKAGDTMTGNLGINNGALYINDTVNGAYIHLTGPGPNPAKRLRAVSGQFQILNDAFTTAILALTDVGGLSAYGSITAGTGATGTYYFGSSVAKYLSYDGANFSFTGGYVYVPLLTSYSDVYAGASGGTGYYRFGNTGVKYLGYDGTNYTLNGGNLTVNGDVTVTRSGAPTTGAVFFGNSAARYLYWTGTQFDLAGPLANLTVNGTLTNTAVPKVGVLIDSAAGRGLSFGVASVTDTGTGFCDVNYNFAFGSTVSHAPMMSVYGVSANVACNINIPQTSAVRLVCIAAATAALTDPQYYLLYDLGT